MIIKVRSLNGWLYGLEIINDRLPRSIRLNYCQIPFYIKSNIALNFFGLCTFF